MKIAVIGAGAMGTLFGGKLAMAGNEVTMIDVVPAVLDAINGHGILLEDETGKHKIDVKAKKAEDMTEKVDLALLFTKTLYSRSALETANNFIGPDTYILTLQNGLGNIELISEFFDFDHILAGVTNYASDLHAPGDISSQGSGYVKVMTANGKLNEEIIAVNQVLLDAGFNSEITEDVFVAIWEKVAFNAAINSTTAICYVPCGGVGGVEEGRFLAEQIARETAMTANAHGVKASAEAIIASLENTYTEHADHFTSMAQDVRRRRKTEVSFINGGIVKKAKEKGLEVPYTEAVYCLLRVIEETYDQQVFTD
ncbi:MAG: 2-dehydropantoate 2-reductase [Eubacteriaceae bacterium]|jgi:2-dehydropantoate 2-reductase|nr:2-dehydropantoate 2-reductase [Eubacteriaceae bacterium]